MTESYRVIALLNGAVFSTLDHILLKQARPLGKSLSEITPWLPEGLDFEEVVSLSPGLWVPVIVWLLLGTDKPILVDTGLASCEELEKSSYRAQWCQDTLPAKTCMEVGPATGKIWRRTG